MEKGRRYLKLAGELLILAVLVGGLAFVLARLRAAPEEGSSTAPTELDTAPTEPYPVPEHATKLPGDPYPGPGTSAASEGTLLTPNPYPGPGDPLPTPTAALVKPPKCTYEGLFTVSDAVTTTVGEYSFSEPKELFKSVDKTTSGIVGWLPDSEHLLLVRHPKDSFREIITYNVFNGDVQIFEKRFISSGKPAWLDDLGAMVYANRSNPLKEATAEEELRLSYGDPASTEMISADIYAPTLSSDGKSVAYFAPSTGGQAQSWSGETKSARSISLDLDNWKYTKTSKYAMFSAGELFRTALHPQGSIIAYYGGQLFLSDLAGSFLCEVGLEAKEGSALGVDQAMWSPDGRYLALVELEYTPGKDFTSLIEVFDLATGLIIHFEIDRLDIYDIAWSPDSQTLATLGSKIRRGHVTSDIFIGNVHQGEFRRISDGEPFGGGASVSWELAWSPDNRMLAVKCPIWEENGYSIAEDRLCLIDVIH